MPEARLAFRPFPAQVDFLRRKVNVPSARWDDLLREDHAHGFMVAGLSRMDVLNDIRQAIAAAQENGETLDDFRARFDVAVRGKWEGWTGSETEARRAWRTRVIYQTNLRTSYMAGRWDDLQKFPFLRYQHNTVANPREDHQAWDGKIIATDDPWWDTHYPPNGWGCRCSVTGVSEARLRALGRKGPDAAPSSVEGDPPPEWAYHVGKAARSLPAASAFGEKVMSLPDAWRTAALADAQQRRVDWFFDWPRFVTRVEGEMARAAPRAQGLATPVGFLSGPVVDALQSGRSLNGKAFQPVFPITALVATADRAIYHALRDQKIGTRPAMRDAFVEALSEVPEWVAKSDAVLWDAAGRTSAALLFARLTQDGDYWVLVVRPNLTEKRTAAPAVANWVRTVERRSVADLRPLPLLAGQLK